jgi:hypothetical protein
MVTLARASVAMTVKPIEGNDRMYKGKHRKTRPVIFTEDTMAWLMMRTAMWM